MEWLTCTMLLTLSSQPCHPLLEMWVVLCLSAQVRPKVMANRVSHSGFPRGKKQKKRKKKGRTVLSPVRCSQHEHWLFCICSNVEIWLLTILAISVLLLWIITLGKWLKCKSQFIREELRSFIALLKMLEESGTTFNRASTHSGRIRPPIFGIFHFFSNWCHAAQEISAVKSVLLALLVRGIERSDLEGTQAARLECKQPLLTSNQPALLQCLWRLPIFFNPAWILGCECNA